MWNGLRTLGQLWRHLGPRWLAYRTLYGLRRRAGALQRRMPGGTWPEAPLSGFLLRPALAEPDAFLEYRRRCSPRFFVEARQQPDYRPYFARWDDGHCDPVGQCADLDEGLLRHVGHLSAETGFPPDWHTDPFSGQRTPADRHWSRIGDCDHGDIRLIWELNRFGFAYAFVRAYWRTGQNHYAELFWQLVEDWRHHNPPQMGANWKCGQEIAFRVMAWCFGLYGLMDAQATSADRVAMLAQMIVVSGNRIEANIDYALSQQNNHGISEALGLWTIGTLFPEFGQSAQWRERGHAILEKLSGELIYPDGSFAQHSFNYHRLMLHDYMWVLRLGELNGHSFGEQLRHRIRKAADLLYQTQDDATGRVPCYGQNDGTVLLPLSNCECRDFRPAVQAASYLCSGARRYEEGPWDEDLLWLFGPAALQAPLSPAAREDLAAPDGGCYTLRSREGFVFTNCPRFRHRPGQADALHVDVWWRGLNVAIDPGTFSYNAPPPWNNPLAGTPYHSTVEVDSRDQMRRCARFLWLPWLRGRVNAVRRSPQGRLEYWEGEHGGYERLRRPVCHRRGVVRLPEEHWLIVDALASTGEHVYRLHWLFADFRYEWDEQHARMLLHTECGDYHVRMGSSAPGARCSLVRADEAAPRGWRAPTYGSREPALSVALSARTDSVYFWTLFGPQPAQVAFEHGRLRIQADRWQARFALQAGRRTVLVDREPAWEQ